MDKKRTYKWPYKSFKDPEYIKDRDKLFKKNGNGWWWFTGTSQGRNFGSTTYKRSWLDRYRKKND